MRHLRSLLYALVLAPTVWTLSAVAFTQELTGRARAEGSIEVFTGFLLLLLAGAAYAILLLPRLSPVGPLVSGVLFLTACVWVLVDQSSFEGVFASEVRKPGFDLTLPAHGLAALLAVPLLCTALSRRRWRTSRFEPVDADTSTIIWPFARPARPGTLVVPGVTGVPASDATMVLSVTRPGATDTDADPDTAPDTAPTAEGDRTQVIPPPPAADAPMPPADATQVLPPADATQKLPPADATQKLPPADATQKLAPADASLKLAPTGDAARKLPPAADATQTLPPTGDVTQLLPTPSADPGPVVPPRADVVDVVETPHSGPTAPPATEAPPAPTPTTIAPPAPAAPSATTPIDRGVGDVASPAARAETAEAPTALSSAGPGGPLDVDDQEPTDPVDTTHPVDTTDPTITVDTLDAGRAGGVAGPEGAVGPSGTEAGDTGVTDPRVTDPRVTDPRVTDPSAVATEAPAKTDGSTVASAERPADEVADDTARLPEPRRDEPTRT